MEHLIQLMTHVETEMRLSVIYIIKLVLNNKL